ncbi:CARDB domain-containing protein [Ferruginibacter sp. SUN106]|uniref:CARDB domain-containing protein n=1 Tax=Ferruginibacter sp. SUN106 TaxID=2978348 RepID=UPI003D35E86B
MKKALIISVCILYACSSALAQIQKIEKPEREVIKKVIPPPPSTLPAGKDLSISIKSFQYDPANGGAIHVTYVVKNNGADAVDLNNVSIQGYIDDPVTRPTTTMPTYLVNGKYYYAGGGHAIASVSTMLNGGQEKENTLHCFNLAKEHYFNSSSNYNYILFVDKANIINETNENNNSVNWSFRGYEGQYNPSLNPAQYYLTDAFITIKTGADNKEKESEVSIRVIPSLIKNLSNDDHNEFIKKVAKNDLEFYSNSPRTLQLGLFMASTYTTVNPPTSLASFSLNGLGTVIEYKANIFTDAWKIEQVELVLHFKDANGIYHPTQGVKTIQFNMPANTFLDGFAKHYLVCKADAALNPVSVKVIDKLSAY